MTRVLFVIPFYKPAYVYGGPVRSVSALCEALCRMDLEVTVFTTNANGPTNLDAQLCNPQQIEGVNTVYFPREPGPLLFYSPQLGRSCAQNMGRYDLAYILSTWGYPLLPACRSARVAGVPYVISPRNSFARTTWRGKFLKKAVYHLLFERRAIKAASALHYTTEFEARESQWLRVGRNFAVVPNPVDVSEMKVLPPPGLLRKRLGVGTKDEIILYMGRVDPDKGIDIVVRALCMVVERHNKARLVIAGPDENSHISWLKDLAHNLGVADRVIFTGMLTGSDRLAAFRDADLFVLASRAENFSMAAVEAMAAGLAVLVSDTVGVARDVAKHGSGMVVPLDYRAVGNALDKLLANPVLRQQMGNAGQVLARSAYEPDAVARLWVNQFGPLAKRRDPLSTARLCDNNRLVTSHDP